MIDWRKDDQEEKCGKKGMNDEEEMREMREIRIEVKWDEWGIGSSCTCASVTTV